MEPPLGFGPWEAADPPEILRGFLALCHHLARRTGGALGEITPADITPNFHTAFLRYGERQVLLLRNIELPLIAFAEPRGNGCDIAFVDDDVLSTRIAEVSDLRLVSAAEMSRPLTRADFISLGGARNRDVTYWRPYTVGEVLFNYWD